MRLDFAETTLEKPDTAAAETHRTDDKKVLENFLWIFSTSDYKSSSLPCEVAVQGYRKRANAATCDRRTRSARRQHTNQVRLITRIVHNPIELHSTGTLFPETWHRTWKLDIRRTWQCKQNIRTKDFDHQSTGTKSEVERTGERTITNTNIDGCPTVTSAKKRERFERDLPGTTLLLLYIFQLRQNFFLQNPKSTT